MPIQFHTEAPPPSQNPVLTWVLRGAGLVAVAVISGLVWWYIHDDTPATGTSQPPTTQQVAGEFDFARHPAVPDSLKDSKCAEHAYGEVQRFLTQTRCQQLTRGLYTTVTADGRTVLTSVSVVRMPADDDAAKLRQKVDTDNTGNIKDLVREGVVKVPGLASLSKHNGYYAVQRGKNVVIVEADFDPASKAKSAATEPDETVLDRICKDAIRLAEEMIRA